MAEGAWSRDDLTFQPVSGLDPDILSALFRNQVLDTMVKEDGKRDRLVLP